MGNVPMVPMVPVGSVEVWNQKNRSIALAEVQPGIFETDMVAFQGSTGVALKTVMESEIAKPTLTISR
jgi:hypothetical protein